jgi:hypothetical protein
LLLISLPRAPPVSPKNKPVLSLASLPAGRRTLYLLPLRSLAYAAFSLLIVFFLLLAIDRLILGNLELAGWTSGELWSRHNKLVEENHRRKTTTNECELRHWTGEPLPASDPTRRKILVLGDSFVWGPPYITLNHLWWRQLAIELQRRGYHNVDVVAAGQPGWSTRRQLECAKTLLPELKPDLILWGYVTNDPDEKLVRQIFDLQDKFPLGQRARSALKRLFPNLMFKFEAMRSDKLAVQYAGPDHGYAYPDWELKLLEGENFARYRQTIDEVASLLQQSKIPAFIQPLPHLPSREYFEPRYAPVRELWQSAGLTVNDTLDPFISRYGIAPTTGPDSLRWGINPADSHPGPKATHFHAIAAADFLEQSWPELLGPKDATQPHQLAINDWLPHNLNVRQTGSHTFDLDYPATTDLMPRLPLDEPTAVVALRYPLLLTEIQLTGPTLKSARLWVSTLDPKDLHDDFTWHELQPVPDSNHIFPLPPQLSTRSISQIRFTAEISPTNPKLTLFLSRLSP